MGTKGKSKGTTEPTGAVKRRATRTARRLTNLAMPGFPPLDRLKARGAKFSAHVEKKLDAVPPERRQQPPATIALPAALQYVLLGEGAEVAELREMFENLLVSSMDRDTAADAHPAFVSMISQLTRTRHGSSNPSTAPITHSSTCTKLARKAPGCTAFGRGLASARVSTKRGSTSTSQTSSVLESFTLITTALPPVRTSTSH